MVSGPVRSSPLFVPLASALALVFGSLVAGGWFGQLGYLVAAVVLAAMARATWSTFDRPSNWAAAAALVGLVSAAVFAATELSDTGRDGGGAAAIIPVAWLFAAAGWYAHGQGVKTLRWVLTLVQVSFTSLSALVFLLTAGRASDGARAAGYGAAGIIGFVGTALAVIAIFGRIRVELAKRNP